LEQFSESQAGFGTTFKGTGGYQKAGREVLEGISQLVIDFIEARRNFILDFLLKKTTENCENHKRLFKNYATVSNYRTFKKYSSRDTIPLMCIFVLRTYGKDGGGA
jgi:hypothetical protein